MEVYCFTSSTAWVVHEGVQSDIFDHLLAILPEFDLQLFQLRNGEQVIPLEPKVFDVLRYLVEHHDRVALELLHRCINARFGRAGSAGMMTSFTC